MCGEDQFWKRPAEGQQNVVCTVWCIGKIMIISLAVSPFLKNWPFIC